MTYEDGIPEGLRRDKNNRAPFMDFVGKYKADYSPLSVSEIAAEGPELTELYKNSTPFMSCENIGLWGQTRACEAVPCTCKPSPADSLPAPFPWNLPPSGSNS